MTAAPRRVLLAVHGARPEAVAVATTIAGELAGAGLDVRVQSDVEISLPCAPTVDLDAGYLQVAAVRGLLEDPE